MTLVVITYFKNGGPSCSVMVIGEKEANALPLSLEKILLSRQ